MSDFIIGFVWPLIAYLLGSCAGWYVRDNQAQREAAEKRLKDIEARLPQSWGPVEGRWCTNDGVTYAWEPIETNGWAGEPQGREHAP